jgi:hypothetical protein
MSSPGTASPAADLGRIDDHDAIASVLQLYIDGSARGDQDKLREAFHEDARMFGAVGDQRFDVPIAEFVTMTAQSPADVDGTYRGRIVAISQVGDAATATIAEDGFWGALSFVDFFLLNRIGGRWSIVSKSFQNTGGRLPG